MAMIQPQIFQAIALKHALMLYAKTRIKANSAYTPANMMATAEKITGRKFKRRDYLGAAIALGEWVDRQ